MADHLEFLSPTDKVALLGLSTPPLLARGQAAMTELGYKVHVAANHEDFANRFFRVTYQVVMLEEKFAATRPAENLSLLTLQKMLMSQRRHATIVLLGESFESLNAMQAFQQSVHAVVNPADLANLKDIVAKVAIENDQFLKVFRDVTADIMSKG